MSENSYIYVEQGLIYIQCAECYKKNRQGSFWPAANGYGGNVKCKCGRIIHQEPEEDDGDEGESPL